VQPLDQAVEARGLTVPDARLKPRNRSHLRMNQLEDTIGMIVENIRAQRFANETAVREAIVMPVLKALGWEIYDPEIVCREYRIENRRVDYGLVTAGTTPVIIVEVKAIGQIPGGDKQLFEYAFHEGVPMAVLSDGREWNFYLPGEHGKYEDRRVYKLDLLERDLGEVCRILRRYLEFGRVKSGEAMEAARNDYRSASQKRQAEDAIPKAWRDMVEEPDELLTELLAEKTESICGFRPEVEQIEEFIVKTLIEKNVPRSDTVSPPDKPSIVRDEPGSKRQRSDSREIPHRAANIRKGTPPKEMEINHKVLIVKTKQATVDRRGNVYEAVRGRWRVNKARAARAEFVIGMVDGICRAVYKPERWKQCSGEQRRFEFEGPEVEGAIKEMYAGKRLPGHMSRNQNPVLYVNVE